MAIIVLEGTDASGKDTYANRIAEALGYEIVRGSSFEISEQGPDAMFQHALGLLERDNVILNRSFYSNLVYAPLFDYPTMTEEQFDILTERYDQQAIVVYLYAPAGIVQFRIAKRGDTHVTPEDTQRIIDGYETAWRGDFRPKRLLSVDTSSDENAEEVVDWLRRLTAEAE